MPHARPFPGSEGMMKANVEGRADTDVADRLGVVPPSVR
jgi:hypothetical protein